MLSCTNLDFFYGIKCRLKNISLKAEAPTLLALFGHNGSGKSTLLNMLCGVLPVRRGKVHFFKENAIDSDGFIKPRFRNQLGVLFQNKSSDEKLSALDNLIYAGAMMGLTRREALRQAHIALTRANLWDRAHERVKKFSFGMQRRLELYRSFLHEPRILFLDEPTAGLDALETTQFFSFLKDYQKKHLALVVMSSHHEDEVLHADRVLMLKDGEVLAENAPDAMVKSLDFFRCSFYVKNPKTSYAFGDLKLFDVIHDEKSSRVHAKVRVNDVDALLLGPLLKENLFKEFSIKKPSITDVYEDLLKKRENIHV